MADRKEYFAKYYLNNKPSLETRRALALANIENRRKQQQAYRDRINPPSDKTLQRRAEREAYWAAKLAELDGKK